MTGVMRVGSAMLIALVAGAASSPRALSPASGGLWEVSRRADGHSPQRLCIAAPEQLAQFEHRAQRCTRVVVSEAGTTATIHYTCAAGGFGNSKVTLVTPRSLKIDTQGISGGLPFHYQLYARRVGDCGAPLAKR